MKNDYVTVSFIEDSESGWEDEDTITEVHEREQQDSWVLDAEQLALFTEHDISIPPRVPEIARLLAEIRGGK
jgi:hypothetical protein